MFDAALTDLRNYIEGVSPQITAELKTPPTRWLVPLPEEGPPGRNVEPSWAGNVRISLLIPFDRFDLANQAVLENISHEIIWRGKPVKYPVVTNTAGYKHAAPHPVDVPELLIATTSPQDDHTVWIYMSIDPDLLAKGGDLRLHKSQVISWFGTMAMGKPGFIVHGRVIGMMQADLIDLDGVKHIKGTIDANLSSGRKELEF